MCKQVQHPEHVRDIARAFKWTLEHIDKVDASPWRSPVHNLTYCKIMTVVWWRSDVFVSRRPQRRCSSNSLFTCRPSDITRCYCSSSNRYRCVTWGGRHLWGVQHRQDGKCTNLWASGSGSGIWRRSSKLASGIHCIYLGARKQQKFNKENIPDTSSRRTSAPIDQCTR